MKDSRPYQRRSRSVHATARRRHPTRCDELAGCVRHREWTGGPEREPNLVTRAPYEARHSRQSSPSRVVYPTVACSMRPSEERMKVVGKLFTRKARVSVSSPSSTG